MYMCATVLISYRNLDEHYSWFHDPFLVNLSLGNSNPYPESSDAIAVERVINAGGRNSFL